VKFIVRTLLIAKDCVQDVANVATPKEKYLGGFVLRGLMSDKRYSRCIADGVEEARRKGMNRCQHDFRQVGKRKTMTLPYGSYENGVRRCV
jgi:hypothetical protein